MFHFESLQANTMFLASVLTSLSVGGEARPTPPPAASPDSNATAVTQSAQHIRLPAVAGLFYPREARTLSRQLDELLAAAPARSLTNLRAIICPHAGYEYSGPVAAQAYKTLLGHDFETVIILAASHYADFEGVSVPATDAYATPLGDVPVSAQARRLARQAPFVLEPRCFVQRPGWSRLASKPEPAVGEDTPETWEHSVEVQVPFLQKTLQHFQILPVMFGRADPERVAKRLAPLLNDRTLIVASTDLSHYHPYAEAKELDQRTVKWICDLDVKSLQSRAGGEGACGRMAVLTLMHLARMKGWTPQLLDYRNSGDTAGDKSRVVGYAAIAFTGPPAGPVAREAGDAKPQPAALSAADQKFLLELARKTLQRVTAGGGLPEVKADAVPESLRSAKGSFVTLTRDGQLRGCIGNLQPADPLYESVMQNTQSAALRDSRFPPVTADEVDKLRIEISVLTEPRPLKFDSPDDLLAKLQPRRDGVVLKIDGRGATFLPQVWEQLPDKSEFLNHLAQKAGFPPAAWRGRGVAVSIYHVEAFAEPK